MKAKVALIDIKKYKSDSLAEALKLIGGVPKLNTPKREVVVKVGVFSAQSNHHSTVGVTGQVVSTFDEAPRIYLAESDSYHGTGMERLQIWKKLFTKRVIPYNLSEDENTRSVKINTEVRDLSIDLSHILFKPRVFVSTHVLRNYIKGSILKNLYGLTPTSKKAQFHKNEIFYTLLADLFEAIGGIDLAVMDGTFFHAGPSSSVRVRTDVLIVGTDAVAVETVGAKLAGLKPLKMETIQQFARRGLGTGSIDDIEIVGASLDVLTERVADASKKAKKIAAERPQPWSPSSALDKLINEGFFALPNKRMIEDVEKQMEEDDSRAKGRRRMIYTNLRRRMSKSKLKAEKGPGGWLYWTE